MKKQKSIKSLFMSQRIIALSCLVFLFLFFAENPEAGFLFSLVQHSSALASDGHKGRHLQWWGLERAAIDDRRDNEACEKAKGEAYCGKADSYLCVRRCFCIFPHVLTLFFNS